MATRRLRLALLWFLGIIVVLLVVATFYAGGVLKAAVETVGPKFTGGPVKLDSARIYPLRGKLALTGFVIGNPPGYSVPDAIRLANFSVDMAPLSVMHDTILVHTVVIDGPELTIVGNPFGDNNLTKIQKHAEAAGSTKAEPAGAESKPKPATPAKPAKKVVIDDLKILNGKIHFGNALTIPLPDIHLKDIGKDKDMTLADTARLVMSAILDGAKEAGSRLFKLGGKGAKLVGEATGDAIGTAAKETVDAAADGIKKLGSELGGLFKTDEKSSDQSQPEN